MDNITKIKTNSKIKTATKTKTATKAKTDNTANKPYSARNLVLLALLTSIVVVLQWLATILPVFPFTLTLVLAPIVIGAALIGIIAGFWLGLVFGVVVLVAGQASLFIAINVPATILIVLLKGALAGLGAGIAYKLLSKRSKTAAVISAAIICPIVNTGIFILASYAFFLPTIEEWALGAGSSVTAFIFLVLVGVNFPIELLINLVLSPTIVRLIQYGQDRRGTA